MKTFKVYTKEKGIVEINNPNDIISLTIHRLDGPAFICYNENSSVNYELYYINGNIHRLNGPAYIKYDFNGIIIYEEYWINCNKYTKDSYYGELLKLKIQII